MTDISSKVLGGTNGALLVVLIWMMMFLAAALIRRRTLYDSWWQTYRGSKPFIALFVLVFGIWARAVMLWLDRIAARSDLDISTYRSVLLVLVILTTVIAVVGAMCWTRVSISIRLPPWSFWAVVATAAVFGIVSAL